MDAIMNNGPIKVLLVEDNPGDARLMQEMLSEAKKFSFRLEFVDRLAKGLERLGQGDVDVVLLDLGLPDSSGFGTFTRVQSEYPQVPIIPLTGMDDEMLAVRAVRAGAQDYLVKGEVSGGLLASAIRYAIERKKAEEALRESEEHYRTLVEESFDGVFVQKGSRIAFANRRLYDMLGYNEGELEGKDHWTIYHPDDQKTAHERAQALMRGERAPSRFEIRLRRKDGSFFEGEINARPVRFGEEVGMQVWIRDLTERKRTEAEHLKIAKLESTGILAGGLAHDFNNILTAILGNISLAKMHVNSGDKVYERLAAAEKASRRAQVLTQQLLTFSKGGAPIKKAQMIKDVIEDSCEFAVRGSSAVCEYSCPDDLFTVEVDAGQLGQAINNLVINAVQAMPQGGKILVTADNVRVNDDSGLPISDGDYVRIAVKDEGVGIPPETISKVFDPYFTTKDEGSGLGLATAHSIIKNHRGLLRVESQFGNGTTFHIYLPVSRKKTGKPSDSGETIHRGRGKILVMDDEEAIRQVAGDLLSILGYEVHFAVDGAEAVEAYKAAKDSSDPFDAVIVDLTVPGGIGGKEAIARLRAIDPGVKAIVSSGYSNDPVMAEYRKHGFQGVVVKPYRVEELSEAVGRLMNE